MTANHGATREPHQSQAPGRLAPRPHVRTWKPAAVPVPRPVVELSAALRILADRLHEALAERRSAPAGSDRWRRADDRVAYVNELYLRLQRRMEVPTEIWSLGDRRIDARGRRPPRPHR